MNELVKTNVLVNKSQMSECSDCTGNLSSKKGNVTRLEDRRFLTVGHLSQQLIGKIANEKPFE